MADQRPADAGQPVAEKGQRHEGDHRFGAVHKIGAHDAGRQEQPDNDGGLARRAQAEAAAQHAVGGKARQLHADESRQKRYRHIERGLGHAEVAIGNQVGGKPGQEKPLARGDGELADIDAPQFAVLEHGEHVVPAEGTFRLAVRAQIDQPAARLDQFDFRRIGAGVARIAIAKPPHQAPGQATDAGHEKHRPPAMHRLQFQQQRLQEGQADELRGGVEADRAGPFSVGKPGGHHLVVDGIGRRFQRTDQQAKAKQGDKASDNAQENRRDRPQDQDGGIEIARPDTVHQPAAGDLEQGVGPAETRQDPAHMLGINAQLLAHQGRGQGDVAAVQEGDGDADKNHQHHNAAMPGRLFCQGHGLCHVTTPQKIRLHAATPAGASDGRWPRRVSPPLHSP